MAIVRGHLRLAELFFV